MNETPTPTEQNFRRVWGPADNGECSGQDDVIFELTSGYEGQVTPSGRTPYIDITYYVRHVPADETNQADDYDRWSVDCVSHTYLLNPLNSWGPDNPEDEDYDYEGGSDLWYHSAESAIRACTNDFAKHDESWKLNGWTPA
jgi:hypothetical protein